MDDAQFWNLIEQSRKGNPDCEKQAERLTRLLKKLPPEEIYDFDRHFARRRLEAYRWDLWAVAYIINGGCSDDGFEYFRCWLIGQGQKAFKAALSSPETIGDLVEDDVEDIECEDILYAPNHAYEQITKTEMPPTEINYPPDPAGERWEEEDLERLYPELWERF